VTGRRDTHTHTAPISRPLPSRGGRRRSAGGGRTAPLGGGGRRQGKSGAEYGFIYLPLFFFNSEAVRTYFLRTLSPDNAACSCSKAYYVVVVERVLYFRPTTLATLTALHSTHTECTESFGSLRSQWAYKVTRQNSGTTNLRARLKDPQAHAVPRVSLTERARRRSQRGTERRISPSC